MVDHVGVGGFTEAAWLADPSKTAQDFYDYHTKQVTHTGMVQASHPNYGVITPAGTPLTDAHAAWNDPGGANDATRQLEIYHSGLLRTVGIPKKHMTRASLPASGDIAEQVYVTDLQITVEWRNAADDLLLTSGAGLAGWHPMESGLMLVENATGSTIEAGRSVAWAGTTATRRVTKTTTIGQQNVLGVALHDIPTGQNGYVAGPGFNRPVLVYAAGTATAVVAGDILVPGATTGVPKSAGPMPSAIYGTSTQRVTGYPRGAFAVALNDSAVDGLITAQMLGTVGQGQMVMRTVPVDAADFTDSKVGAGTGAWTDHDFSALLLSAKHVPFAVILGIQTLITTASGDDPADAEGQVSPDQSNLGARLLVRGRSNGVPQCSVGPAHYTVPTSNDSAAATTIGAHYGGRAVLTTGQSVAIAEYVLGYWH